MGDIDEISSLRRRVAELEASLKEGESYGMRLHKFKEELLERANRQQAAVAAFAKEQDEKREALRLELGRALAEKVFVPMDGIMKTMSALQASVGHLGQQVNAHWNVVSAALHAAERRAVSGGHVADRAAFRAALVEAGREVLVEIVARELSDLARMRAQKEAGEEMMPAPVSDMTTAEHVLVKVAQADAAETQDRRADLEELVALRQEAANNEAQRRFMEMQEKAATEDASPKAEA